MVAKIATNRIAAIERVKPAAVELGSKGGKASAKALSKTTRKKIARQVAKSRWA